MSSRTSSPLRLTTRGRLLLGASGLVVALSLLSATTALGSNEASTQSNKQGAKAGATQPISNGYEQITVLPGESLWSIARQLTPDFSECTGDIVALLIDINNLTSSELQTGQELLVPIK